MRESTQLGILNVRFTRRIGNRADQVTDRRCYRLLLHDLLLFFHSPHRDDSNIADVETA